MISPAHRVLPIPSLSLLITLLSDPSPFSISLSSPSIPNLLDRCWYSVVVDRQGQAVAAGIREVEIPGASVGAVVVDWVRCLIGSDRWAYRRNPSEGGSVVMK